MRSELALGSLILVLVASATFGVGGRGVDPCMNRLTLDNPGLCLNAQSLKGPDVCHDDEEHRTRPNIDLVPILAPPLLQAQWRRKTILARF